MNLDLRLYTEAERNRLRDESDELRGEEGERRDLRRRTTVAEEAAGTLRLKAERCDLAEAGRCKWSPRVAQTSHRVTQPSP